MRYGIFSVFLLDEINLKVIIFPQKKNNFYLARARN